MNETSQQAAKPSATQTAIKAAMKEAMKNRAKDRLGAIRLMQSEFKRIEVDERIVLDESRVLSVLDKMLKQRRDSQKQYEEAGRAELAAIESFEISVIQEFLPQQLSEAELATLVDDAIAAAAADGKSGMQAMGSVMAVLKPQVQGRADIGAVSQTVKARLT